MVYTRKEVIQYVNEEDVKFIRLAFCDAVRKPKEYFRYAERTRTCVRERHRH